MFNPIIDIDGVLTNCLFVERYMEESLFHRINSHLWIRSTDPIVDKLVDLGLCERRGFPYIECKYKHNEIVKLRKIFDIWCNSNMKEYYSYADILMAKGISGNEDAYNKYKEILRRDVEILKKLVVMCKEGYIEQEGIKYIEQCMVALR